MLDRYHFLTFSQLITLAVAALEEPGTFRRGHGSLRHLIVDEYQDINPAQEHLIERLAQPPVEPCVVGDDDQAIYQWRGSDVATIVGFRARRAAQTIARLHASGVRYRDVAVLYRSVRTSAPPLIEALRRLGIPFSCAGRTGLFLQPEVALLGEVFAWFVDGEWRDDRFGDPRPADLDHIVAGLVVRSDKAMTNHATLSRSATRCRRSARYGGKGFPPYASTVMVLMKRSTSTAARK